VSFYVPVRTEQNDVVACLGHYEERQNHLLS
jgi:hypothetical protein